MVKTITVITGFVAIRHELLCGYVSPLIVCQHLCCVVSPLVVWLCHHWCGYVSLFVSFCVTTGCVVMCPRGCVVMCHHWLCGYVSRGCVLQVVWTVQDVRTSPWDGHWRAGWQGHACKGRCWQQLRDCYWLRSMYSNIHALIRRSQSLSCSIICLT